MKPRAEHLAYRTAQEQLRKGTFVSKHACKCDVRGKLIWQNDDLVETGIQTALKEHYAEI